MVKFEKTVLKQGQDIFIEDEKLMDYLNPQFYLHKTGIIIFKPKKLNIDTEPTVGGMASKGLRANSYQGT